MKGQQQTGLWVLGAVLLAAIVAVIAYFTLISPQLDARGTARDQAQATRDQNDLLEIQIARMKSLEQQVPDWRDQIAKISLDLPPTPEAAALERLVSDTLAGTGLPLIDMSAGKATVIEPSP